MKASSPFALLALLLFAGRAEALTNLAVSGTPSASSQAFGAVVADGNDGNRNGNISAGSVFHTNNEATQSFWQVNLGGVRYLDHVRIFNRVDAVQGSVANFRIIAKNGATEVFNQTFLPANATDQNNARAWGTADLRGVQADFVRIERVSQTTPAVNFLTFAEFEVWGSTAALEPLIAGGTVTASTAGFGSTASDANDGDINGNLFGPNKPVYQSSAQDPLIVGNFAGDNLSNGGEEVKLSYGAGTSLRAFTYTDQAPWPVEADGTDRTLVLRAPQTRPDHSLPTSWRASLANGGSPGSDDGTSYGAWKTAHGVINDTDDIDGDGLTAFLEYVIGGDPVANSRANLPAVSRNPDGSLTIDVTQALAADDVTFVVETSLDLGSWVPATVTLQGTATSGALHISRYILSPSTPPDAQRFVRVQYEVP